MSRKKQNTVRHSVPAVVSSVKPAVMSSTEAAIYLGVTKSTLEWWRSSGQHKELVYIKVGGLVKYRVQDLDRWLASRAVGTGPNV